MLEPKSLRAGSGIVIEGQEFGIEMTPLHSGEISITVLANTNVTGLDLRCKLGRSEARYTYKPRDITVGATALECRTVDRLGPFFSEGIQIKLEPGMAKLIHAAMPKLAIAAVVAGRLSELLTTQMGRVLNYQMPFVEAVVGRIVFEGSTPSDAIASELEGTMTGLADDALVACLRTGEAAGVLAKVAAMT